MAVLFKGKTVSISTPTQVHLWQEKNKDRAGVERSDNLLRSHLRATPSITIGRGRGQSGYTILFYLPSNSTSPMQTVHVQDIVCAVARDYRLDKLLQDLMYRHAKSLLSAATPYHILTRQPHYIFHDSNFTHARSCTIERMPLCK